MGDMKYGSKLYNDIKGSLPSDVFAKKYGHIKPPVVKMKPTVKVKPKQSGLGAGKNLDELMKVEKKRRSVMSSGIGGIVSEFLK